MALCLNFSEFSPSRATWEFGYLGDKQIFMGKILNIFLSSVNMFFGAQKAGSFEHAQLIFWLRNRKIKKKVVTHTYLVLTY